MPCRCPGWYCRSAAFVDHGLERGPVVGQRHDRLQIGAIAALQYFAAGDVFLGRKHASAHSPGRRRVLGVVVLVAVGDAAGPGVVARPASRSLLLLRQELLSCSCLLHVPGCRSIRVPVGPVDPGLVVVAGADIDVLGEGNDRDVDVAGGSWRARSTDRPGSWRRSASPAILPSSAIDPVLSSTIATRIRTLPQAAVEAGIEIDVGEARDLHEVGRRSCRCR